MEEEHEFLVPDYYLSFCCKMGACRSACCIGWQVSISMRNYFYLLGLNCRDDLRSRIDCGLRVVDSPTEEEYARFEPRYDGNCPLRMSEGRCSLHAELGEDVLPDVCRLYPRGIRVENNLYECSCANSCEAVLEILFEKKDKMSFSFERLNVKIPPVADRKSFFETLGLDQKIRLYLISLIQNRDISLPDRIISLGKTLDQMDRAIESGDKDLLVGILEGKLPKKGLRFKSNNICEEHLRFGLKIAEQMMEILDVRSQSIRESGKSALAYFCDGNDALERYYTAKSHFETLFPDWEVFYEHMLVNHMFFSQFPFQDRPESMHNEYVALCAVYSILRFLGLGCMAEKNEKNILIDVMAATFRLIDHTEYDRYAFHLLKKLDSTSEEKLYDLIAL